MFSLVQFDNGELSVLSSKRIKITDGSNCIVRYIGGAKYSANVLDSSDTESFLIDAKEKISNDTMKLLTTNTLDDYSNQATDRKASVDNLLRVPASRKTANNGLKIKKSNDTTKKKSSRNACKRIATGASKKYSDQQTDQKKSTKNLLEVPALPKSSEGDVKDKKLNVNSLKSTTIRKKSEIIFPSDQNLIKVSKKMKTVNLSKIAVSKMVLQDSKTGTADNSTLLPSSQLGSSTQDTKRYCVNSLTPLNSLSTCSDNLGLSSILEDSKMINNDKADFSDFSKEHHDMKINSFVPETPTNSLSNTSVRLDASNLTDKNNMNSTNESPPPSGYSEELNKLGPNWPYDSSENVGSNVVNSYNSNIDKSTEGIEHSSNHNSENINTNDTYSVTNVPDNLITNLTENDNEESIIDASNDKGESMTKAQDSSYNPLNTTNESPLQTPIMKKINLKKSPPLLKSSLDIRKLNVPYASYIANANDLNPNGPQAAHREHKTKKHFCPYCKTLQSKFARHLMLKHKTEKDVRSFLFLPKHHFQRLKIIDMIRRKGDFLHNTDKDLNSGILILPRRRQENSTNTSEDYTCCTMCKGFFPNQTIRFHAKNCQTGRNKLARDILVSGRRVTGFIHEIANDMLRNEIFPILRDDDVSRSIRYDELIIKFGNKLIEKYALKHQHDGMRAQLRLLGRLKLEIMSNDNKITEFQDIFRPQNYDVVIKSLRNVANWDTASMTFKTPAVAKNLVTLVIKCCKKYRAECVKIQDEERKKLAEDFLLLWLEEVPLLINKKAEDDRNEQRLLKKVILPSKEDIKL